VTQIDFYTHVPDKLRTACVLCTKAFARGLRVTVFCADAGTAQRFDRMLWTTPAIGFVPHCAPDDLHPERPAFFSRYQRLVEIVGIDDDDRAQARDRFRFYRDRGYEIRTHDLSKNREA
jgi:DNA polymerase-3 subunit chi